ncbi:hypothetical protein B0H34DRAFT_660613 [Crassisporium funariophilum]|nr:hypothetical protein B0H34DRAFT_660613 [Crassisporium funariophilum]
MLADENLCNKISIFLLSIGNKISAKKLMDFLAQPDVREKFGIEKPISYKTACQYLNSLGYQYRATPKGQYADGHKRDDVVFYWESVFLPQWHRIHKGMATWVEKLVESGPCGVGRRIITWFHNESIFYAHDRRKKGWCHKDAPARPYTKGEHQENSICLARLAPDMPDASRPPYLVWRHINAPNSIKFSRHRCQS